VLRRAYCGRTEIIMNSIVTQEFKSTPFQDLLGTRIGSTVTWESPRLTTMYPRPGAVKGADRGICRTVNAALQVEILEKQLLLGDNTGVTVTAGLWGEYNKVSSVIASNTYALDEKYAFTTIFVPPIFTIGFNPGNSKVGYGVPYYQSNGQLGFVGWSTFSNQAQNVYIKLAFVRATPQNNLPFAPVQTVPIPIKIRCSGILLASDLS
jgi:hypothetical protein